MLILRDDLFSRIWVRLIKKKVLVLRMVSGGSSEFLSFFSPEITASSLPVQKLVAEVRTGTAREFFAF